MKRTERQELLRSHARQYAEAGFSVIPLIPRSKNPAGAWKAAQARKMSPEAAEEAWATPGQDGCNIGIVTGDLSHVFVLDWDGDEHGWVELQVMGLPDTATVATANGRHFYFRHPGFPVRNGVQVISGCDIRGDGGYVVAPPSVHPDGTTYMWEGGGVPAWRDIAPPPIWLRSILVARGRHQPDHEPEATDPGGQERAVLSYATRQFIADGAPQGERNNRLFKAAADYAGSGYSQQEAHADLVPPASGSGLGEPEVARTIDSAYSQPRTPARPSSRQGSAQSVDIAEYNTSDAGNAELLVALYGRGIRYIHGRAQWVRCVEGQWHVDDRRRLTQLAIQAARERGRLALDLTEQDARARQVKWAIGSESGRRLEDAVRIAASHPYSATMPSDWDADANLVGVENGLIDLRTGKFRQASRDDLLLCRLGTHYDPSAECPRWLRFVDEVFAGEQHLVEFVRRAFGYSITGDTSEEVLFIAHGPGGNGKSVMLNILDALGGDYATTTPFSTFERREGYQGVPNDLAALHGKRIVSAREVEEDKRLNEARIKATTGRDPISCRFMRGEFFTYTPTFKVWMAVNHLPAIRDTSAGMWRRIRVIPFSQSFIGREDKRLEGALREELPGILNWALRGVADWRHNGDLGKPDSVATPTSKYQEQSDAIARFVGERCELNEAARAGATALYGAFLAWSGLGKDDMSQTAFGDRMTEKGYARGRDGSGRTVYLGLSLAPREATEPAEGGANDVAG